jgi:hypothetical protein
VLEEKHSMSIFFTEHFRGYYEVMGRKQYFICQECARKMYLFRKRIPWICFLLAIPGFLLPALFEDAGLPLLHLLFILSIGSFLAGLFYSIGWRDSELAIVKNI